MRQNRGYLYYLILLIFCSTVHTKVNGQKPAMYYSDSGVIGRPYAKDPFVIWFNKQYLMYYSIPGKDLKAWYIGIAKSNDLVNWQKVGDIKPKQEVEKKGICAPGCIIRDGKVHLFYQTYGNGKKDAICHAVSQDGIGFERDADNPIFRPTTKWSIGRAIDAEVVLFKDKYFLYYATRDTAYKIQEQGVAVTDANSNFSKSSWTNLSIDSAILKPQMPWEKKCIEAASCTVRGNELFMFYAGGFNNEPQQIGVAKSRDGFKWERVFADPILVNGKAGSWNESESGHPNIFRDKDGKYHLFFQGNNDNGNTWYLSKVDIGWNAKGPYLK